MKTIALFASLIAFYGMLSGQFHSFYLMMAGVVSAAAITALAKQLRILDDEGLPLRYWLRTALYLPWLMWQVILANIDVAKQVWRPSLDISPRMIRVPHELETAYGIATYANSITLTPGTVTVEIGEREFLVHALTKQAADDLLSGEMHRRVKWVEGTTSPAQEKHS